MNVPCILPAKQGTSPPAKADCVSASGKTRPFAPTVRADFLQRDLKTQAFESEKLWRGRDAARIFASAKHGGLLSESLNRPSLKRRILFANVDWIGMLTGGAGITDGGN